ncbi:sugar-binding protein [Pseudoalteromonas porphyrae]|uniref:substrate-binding domain-containing protein n=1 Tax=Pseudoalteromonas porphyrae TaxID=187330 RepID=UPI0006BB2A4A|nr:substrate-binding domain-containing protein [Pseudoalteromonas porphyrae]KPH96441.1 sugar-binding protein [Pseudoalteromonas porphyrae]
MSQRSSVRFKHIKIALLFLISSVCVTFTLHAKAEIVIGIVGKTKNDSFYIQSFKGCLKFAESMPDVTCVYDGPDDYQDIRTQSLIIQDLVKDKIDGLLLATTDSDYLVSRVLKDLDRQNIPVITFDSDLLPKDHQYRLAYVGTNNFEFGVALGNQIKLFAKDSPLNTVCIQSGHQTTPNLNERIAGVRFALSGKSEKRLSGENGWDEFSRCPLYSLGKRGTSLEQLKNVLKMKHPPLFLAVAGFAQFNSDYIKSVQSHKSRIESGNVVIISADTEEVQLRALKQGLSQSNIGQNPFEMGRLSAELMYNFIVNDKKPEKPFYYLDFHYCTKKNVDTCTKNY